MPGSLSLHFVGTRGTVGEVLERSMKGASNKVSANLRATADAAAAEILRRTKQDIAQYQRFGPDWIDSMQAKITETKGNIKVTISNKQPFFQVLLKGKVIQGKPLLWLPLDSAGAANKHIYAKDYGGRLVRVNRKEGPPLLLDTRDKQPKYVGLESVRIPKYFHTREIIADVASKLEKIYRKLWSSTSP